MDYLKNNNDWEDPNCEFIEISKVNDNIIKKLVNNLKQGVSDNFYIAFESLLKIGKKAESLIESALSEVDEAHNFKKDILSLILECAKGNKADYPLILQLYHPDFVIRIRAITQLENNQEYLRYLLPLLDDPDDSVRWAVIKKLIEGNQLQNPIVQKRLDYRMKIESNHVIRAKLLDVCKGFK